MRTRVLLSIAFIFLGAVVFGNLQTLQARNSEGAEGQEVTMSGKAELKRENGTVWIEGVPSLQWGIGKGCTYIGALEAALAVSDTPHRYANLMGYSGLAFRVRWYHGNTGRSWCMSSPVGEFPEEMEALAKATGRRMPLEVRLGQKEPKMEELAPAIKASIDAGKPVLAYEPAFNMAVIYGYKDEGRTWLMRDYMKQGDPIELAAEKLGPMVIYLGEKTDGLSRKEAVLAGLQMGASNWQRIDMPGRNGKYWMGKAALENWISDLGDVDSLNQAQMDNLFNANWWNFDGLYDSRAAAVHFLRDASGEFQGETGEALSRAADLFDQERELFCALFTNREAFFGPWSGKSIADWDDGVRERERSVLARAMTLEEKAFAEVGKALEAEGVPGPSPRFQSDETAGG